MSWHPDGAGFRTLDGQNKDGDGWGDPFDPVIYWMYEISPPKKPSHLPVH